MWYAALISMVIVFLAVVVHFMALWSITYLLQRRLLVPAFRVGAAVYLLLLAHLLEVVLFGASFYLAVEYLGIGSLKGEFGGDFREYIYFSLVSYTSLGLGDVYPHGPIRLITGIEALTGLMMIGWSASFTYLCMVKLWGSEKEA
jgi:hypothetical protein